MAKTVLVVEDNELNLRLFCDILTAHGYAPVAVRDGRQCLEAARAADPALIIMDIQLPHISGLELIAALKGDAALGRVPVMAVTAYAGAGDEARIRGAGAEAYVAKPISIRTFLATVQAFA